MVAMPADQDESGSRDKHRSFRSETTCESGIQHSASPGLDNCYRDYAQRNASELAELLNRMNSVGTT
jgi:hypothetical protein